MDWTMDWTVDWTLDWTAWDHHKKWEPLHYAPLAQSSGIGKEFVTFQSQSRCRMTQ